MPNVTVNVTKNKETLLKTLEESIEDNSLICLIGALKTIKESSNAFMTTLVDEQKTSKLPEQVAKTENTEEDDSEEDSPDAIRVSSPKKLKAC